ncbi:MAG: iron ABC transporter permease [Chromatiales bacterium]|jgi:iron complex transport system permease protein
MLHRSTLLFFASLLLISGLSLLLALSIGEINLAPSELVQVLNGQGDHSISQIVSELRWPRAATAFITGGLLALSGALMQVLLRNPLADPYILGISGGAAVAALLVLTAGLAAQWLEIAAFSGAMLSMLLVFLLARHHARQLLLTGVVLAAGWGAVINLLLIVADSQTVHSMLFWLMGDFTSSRPPALWMLVLLLVATLVSWLLARDLNLLTHGEQRAATMGSPVRLVRWITFGLASLCTAVAVSLAGSIGFIGLIVPHLLRLLIGSNHRLLLPAAVLTGGSLLTLADTGARSLLAPQQLPVGVITALLGVPLFLYLLRHR